MSKFSCTEVIAKNTENESPEIDLARSDITTSPLHKRGIPYKFFRRGNPE